MSWNSIQHENPGGMPASGIMKQLSKSALHFASSLKPSGDIPSYHSGFSAKIPAHTDALIRLSDTLTVSRKGNTPLTH